MSTAIHSVKVTALKGAEIKLTVRSLEKGCTVSFCPILALRCLSALGAAGPVGQSDFLPPNDSPGELHDYVAECLESARASVPKASATFTLKLRDADWLKKIKKGDTRDTAAYAATARRVGAAFTAEGTQLVIGWDSGAVEAHEVTQKRGRTTLGKPVWAAQHLGLVAFTLLAEDVLVTAGRTELRAHREGEPVAEVSLETGAKVTAIAADGTRALLGFADGSVAAWQPGKAAALVRLAGVDGPVVGLAAVGKDVIAVATSAAVAVLRKGAIATTVASADGPITALAKDTAAGAFVFGTARGAVVFADADGKVARKHQTQIPQDSVIGVMHCDAQGTVAALARRGNRLFVATLAPDGIRFAGPIAEVDDFGSTAAADGLLARVNKDQALYLGLDGSVRFSQTLPKGVPDPRVTRDGGGLIVASSESRHTAELRAPTGAVLASAYQYGQYFDDGIPLGRDAALVWLSNDRAFRFTAAGSEELSIRVHNAAAIERTGGAFAMLREENEDGEREDGRLVELDASGRVIAELGKVPADDFLNSGGLLASDDGSLFKASIYDSQKGHVQHCWVREGAAFREVPAPWDGDWPTFSADGRRVAWQSREHDAFVLYDPHAGRELARIELDGYLCQFDGSSRLVIKSGATLHWFGVDGEPCGETPLPAREIVTPPITRLLPTGGKRGVVVVTALNAFVLGGKGEPAPLHGSIPLAATETAVAVARGWPLEVVDL
ncbi:hypothetical protein [Nannocystis punicea]|uniref:WD40 repeat n=1 Tax=Nannocystis punicea TaxID=2995304 RepID=A0ABY7GS92_9BACT|nr:hypothetical protein [Nannocystis poenicansa]WAS89809.1 hypothetical protein O0S08_26760 [Nannocystis poenicansa]